MDESTSTQVTTSTPQLSSDDAEVLRLLADQSGDSPDEVLHRALQAYAKRHLVLPPSQKAPRPPLGSNQFQSRHDYSGFHMVAAENCAHRCQALYREVADATTPEAYTNTFPVRLWDSLVAVLLVAAAIDAAVMELLFEAENCFILGVEQGVAARIAALREPFVRENVGTTEKMKRILGTLNAEEEKQQALRFKQGKIWQDAAMLIHLRNLFTHTSLGYVTTGPEGDELDGRAELVETYLRGKFKTDRTFPLVQVVFPDTYLGPGLAQWAVGTGYSVIREFYTCLGAAWNTDPHPRATQSRNKA